MQTSFAGDDESIEARVKGLLHMDGFFDLYWDESEGRLLLYIEQSEGEFIYQSSLARGVGSNDLGLDRGQLGATRLVEFFRAGPKVLMIEKNTGFRANSHDPAERAAVESSFARSVIWGFELVAVSGNAVLVDATDFFLRDAHGVSSWLNNAQQGSYKVDPQRSAIFLPRTRAFPDNTEIEAVITYTGERKYDAKGAAASDILPTVVPDPGAITVHLHHSLIRLPDSDYTPLAFDPRTGMIASPRGNGFMDFAVRIGEPIRTSYARRHRLEKKNPTADTSEAVEPIIYYVDPGAPEPIRSALMEGAGWWNQAFESAGYSNAFQVRLLPEDADPMDVRYNVIQWVHRSTRGWSYGSSVLDPRTGEILKGHVTLGSLRVRQDYLIAEGLLAPYTGSNVPEAMLEMSLARIRQLAAHEVGHTLGLEHNFAASVDNRSSVMDYPFPLVRFNARGGLDLSDAYGVGIGAWDKRTIQYAYQDFPADVNENKARQNIVRETLDSGLLFVADNDSRDPGSAHPQGNLWDNGADAIEELAHLLKVRAYALENFSIHNIQPGRPLATLEEVLVPIYLLHRFQIQAVAKLIGGQYFTYGLRGDGLALPKTVASDRQQAAIDALLATLDPTLLAVSQSLLDLIPPRPPGYGPGRESFTRSTGVTFDPLAPAGSAVSLTLDVLFNSRRAARMNVFHATEETLPGYDSLLRALMNATWYQPRENVIKGAIQRDTGYQVLQHLMALSVNTAATSQVRSQSLVTIQGLDQWLATQKSGRKKKKAGPDKDWAAHYALVQQEIRLWLKDPQKLTPVPAIAPPPGSPIGN